MRAESAHSIILTRLDGDKGKKKLIPIRRIVSVEEELDEHTIVFLEYEGAVTVVESMQKVIDKIANVGAFVGC